MKSPLASGILACIALAVGLTARGQMAITIQNPGFEAPVATSPGYAYGSPPGWSTPNFNAGGVWNINDFSLGLWTVPAPELKQVGFLDPSFGEIPYLHQVLTATLQADRQYTLTGYVGDSLHAGYDGNYRVSLLAGGTEVAFLTGDAIDGAFEPFTLPFDSAGSSLVGQPLAIRLATADLTSVVAFDAIEFVVVPEPHRVSVAMALLLAGFGLWYRRVVR